LLPRFAHIYYLDSGVTAVQPRTGMTTEFIGLYAHNIKDAVIPVRRRTASTAESSE